MKAALMQARSRSSLIAKNHTISYVDQQADDLQCAYMKCSAQLLPLSINLISHPFPI